MYLIHLVHSKNREYGKKLHIYGGKQYVGEKGTAR